METLEGIVLDAQSIHQAKPPVFRLAVSTHQGLRNVEIPMGKTSFYVVCEPVDGGRRGQLGLAKDVHSEILKLKPESATIETMSYLNEEVKAVKVDVLAEKRSEILEKIERRFNNPIFRTKVRRNETENPIANKWLYPIKLAGGSLLGDFLVRAPFMVGSYISVRGGKTEKRSLVVDGIDSISIVDKHPDLDVLYLDSEQANPAGFPHPRFDPTMLVSYAHSRGSGLIESDLDWRISEKNGRKIITGGDEASIYDEMIRLTKDFHVLVGHNILEYDIPFWVNRCGILGLEPAFGRDGSRPVLRQGGSRNFFWWDFDGREFREVKDEDARYPHFKGFITIDTRDSMKYLFTPSAKLKALQEVTNKGSKGDIGARFSEYYMIPEKREEARQYALDDAVNLMDAAKSLGIVDGILNVADITGQHPEIVAMRSKYQNLRKLHEALIKKRGDTLPFDTDIAPEHLEAAVEELMPKRADYGIHEGIKRISTKSLISDQIMRYNICPTTFYCKKGGCDCGGRKTPHGFYTFCDKEMGHAPEVIQKFMDFGDTPFEREMWRGISDEAYMLLIPMVSSDGKDKFAKGPGSVLRLAIGELPEILDDMGAVFCRNNDTLIRNIDDELESFTAIIGRNSDDDAATLMKNGVIYPIGHKMELSRWPKFFVDKKLEMARSIFKKKDYSEADEIYDEAVQKIKTWDIPISNIAYFAKVRRNPEEYTYNTDIQRLVDRYGLKRFEEIDYFFDAREGVVRFDDLRVPDIEEYKRRFDNIVSPFREVPAQYFTPSLEDFM